MDYVLKCRSLFLYDAPLVVLDKYVRKFIFDIFYRIIFLVYIKGPINFFFFFLHFEGSHMKPISQFHICYPTIQILNLTYAIQPGSFFADIYIYNLYIET